jgi:hypothetical protein
VGVNYCTDLLFLNMYCVGGYFEAEGRTGVCASVPSLTVVHVPFMYTSFQVLGCVCALCAVLCCAV